MTRLLIALCVLSLPTLAAAQTPIKNPTRVMFNPGPDAALLTGYEVDIISAGGAVAQTMTFPRQTSDANGDVTLSLNLQPVAFGLYTAVVRNVVVGGLVSINSVASDPWERAPGQPSKPRFSWHLTLDPFVLARVGPAHPSVQ
jgi:hypothetical protein